MSERRMVGLLKFFDSCGFNTKSTSLSNDRNVTCLIACAHILMAVVFTAYEFLFFYQFNHFTELSEIVNEFIEYSGSICAYWLIIFDSICHGRANQRFWTIFHQSNVNIRRQSNVIPRSYLIKIVEFFSAKMVVDLIFVTHYDFGGFVGVAAVLLYVAYIIPIVISIVRIFYYIFCLEIVLHDMKTLQGELKNIEKSDNCSDLQCSDWVHKYNCIHGMVDLLNEIFGLSQVGAVLLCFYTLFTDMNYLYIHFDELSAARMMCEQRLWPIPWFSIKTLLIPCLFLFQMAFFG